MSLRRSRSVAVTLSPLIVVMMIVWAPVMAVAHAGTSEAPSQPPDDPVSAASQSAMPAEARANSNRASGHAGPATMTPSAQHGNRTEAPGQNNVDTSATPSPPPQSKGGGNSTARSDGRSTTDGNPAKTATTAGGSDVPRSHQDKRSNGTPSGNGDGPTTGANGANCDGDPSGGSNTGNGANTSGDFDNTCDTSPGGPAPNGNGSGSMKGKPCAGCVGNADDKNPPAQSHRPEDGNAGYECDRNNGVGKGNPAHTGCRPAPPPPRCTVNCAPPPVPITDCDDDGVPDDVDTDLSDCEPIIRPDLCPDGSERPASGICDEVLGEIIDRDPKPVFPGGRVVAGERLGAPEPEAQAAVLPFTGGNLLPFLIVSLALTGVGGTLLRRRVTATTENEAG